MLAISGVFPYYTYTRPFRKKAPAHSSHKRVSREEVVRSAIMSSKLQPHVAPMAILVHGFRRLHH